MPGHQGEKEKRPKKEAGTAGKTRLGLKNDPGREAGRRDWWKKRGEAVSVGRSSAAAARKPCLWREDGSWPVATISAPAHIKSNTTSYTGADEHTRARAHTLGVAKVLLCN